MIQVKSLLKRFEDREVLKGIDATFETEYPRRGQ